MKNSLSITSLLLFEHSFTSIGYTHDTEPNPALKTESGTFLPALSLLNGSVERHGRANKKESPSSSSSSKNKTIDKELLKRRDSKLEAPVQTEFIQKLSSENLDQFIQTVLAANRIDEVRTTCE